MYKKIPDGRTRDGVNVREIAALRPILDTRPHCEPNEDEPATNTRGHEGDNRLRWFNEELRSGSPNRSPEDE